MVPLPQIGWYASQNCSQFPVRQRFSSGFGDMKNVLCNCGAANRRISIIILTVRPTTGTALRKPKILLKIDLKSKFVLIRIWHGMALCQQTDQDERRLFHWYDVHIQHNKFGLVMPVAHVTLSLA